MQCLATPHSVAPAARRSLVALTLAATLFAISSTALASQVTGGTIGAIVPAPAAANGRTSTASSSSKVVTPPRVAPAHAPAKAASSTTSR